MIPTTFEHANFVYTKPKGMTDEQCFDLPVYKGIDQDKNPVIISCWKLSKEDLEDVQKSGCVYLQIVSYAMPPVVLYTENPFE